MENFFHSLETVNSSISSALWGPLTSAFVLFVGFLLTVKTKFFQVLKIKIWFKNTVGTVFKKQKSEKGVSPLQAVSAALAGCIGTGNIVGVATAVSLGGPGALFWMWIAAILGMMTSFAENTLAVKYREKDANNNFIGGPMFYIEKRLKCRTAAVTFAVLSIFATLGTGNMLQANSISEALKDSFGVPQFTTGILLFVLTTIVIFGGITRIVRVTDKIVPIMAGVYILGGLIIILSNFSKIGNMFCSIISNAFDFRPIGGSVAACCAIRAMRYGVARGLFSNEAGLGSSPIVHASSNTSKPTTQGMWGIFQIFIDTIVVCTVTGFSIIITSGPKIQGEGVQITKNAFNSVVNNFGGSFVYITLILFAFSTIISWSYVGEKGSQYLFGEKSIRIYRIFVCSVTIVGATMKAKALWDLCDSINAVMMCINLVAVLLLSKEVAREFKENV